MFQPLPSTRYDLRFSIAGIPVSVHPLFWLIALLLGSSGNLLFIPVWMLVIFVSILVHELGHAFAFRRYGQRSQIVLHFMGGLTIPEPVYWGSRYASVGLTPNQNIVISLAGPVAGFLLAGLVIGIVLIAGGSIGTERLLGFLPLPWTASLPIGGQILTVLLSLLVRLNFFWGLINLMPVYPLDGGNITRNVLLQTDPIDGVRKSLWVSVIAGALLALVGLVFWGSIFMALLFGVLAFQSYQMMQRRY